MRRQGVRLCCFRIFTANVIKKGTLRFVSNEVCPVHFQIRKGICVNQEKSAVSISFAFSEDTQVLRCGSIGKRCCIPGSMVK